MSEVTLRPGEPETRILDPALAEDMAYAGKQQREILAMGNLITVAVNQLQADLACATSESDEPRDTFVKTYIKGARVLNSIGELYGDSSLARLSDLGLVEEENVRGSLSKYADTLPGVRSRQREKLEAEAERREYWAEKLFSHPDTELTLNKVIGIEHHIAERQRWIDIDQKTAARLRDMAQPVPASEIVSIHKEEVYDYFRHSEDYDPEAWEKLSSNPSTTLEELRLFVAAGIDESDASMQSFIDKDQAILDDIREPKKETQ